MLIGIAGLSDDKDQRTRAPLFLVDINDLTARGQRIAHANRDKKLYFEDVAEGTPPAPIQRVRSCDKNAPRNGP